MLEHLLHETLTLIISSIRMMTVPEIKQFIQPQDGCIKLLSLALFNTSFLLFTYIIKNNTFHHLYQHLELYFPCLLADAAKQNVSSSQSTWTNPSVASFSITHLFVSNQKVLSQRHKIFGLLFLQLPFTSITIFTSSFIFFLHITRNWGHLKELSMRTLLTSAEKLAQQHLHVVVPLELQCLAETKAVKTCTWWFGCVLEKYN